MTDLLLIDADGSTSTTLLRTPPPFTRPASPLTSRIVFAEAPVIREPSVATGSASNSFVASGSASNSSAIARAAAGAAPVDWDATLAFQRHLWSWGLGVSVGVASSAGGGATRELITRSAAEARSAGGALVVAIGVDGGREQDSSAKQEDTVEPDSLAAIIDAYRRNLHFAENAGADIVLSPSRALARIATSAADYRRVYNEVLTSATKPVILQWLGQSSATDFSRYFGSPDVAVASRTMLEIINENSDRVSGLTLNLLDAHAEIGIRASLPATAPMFTGDEFNYVGLVAGTGGRHSNAILDAFASVAPAASAAIQALDAGDRGEYESILGPTEDLARVLSSSRYPAGAPFLAWLNGHRDTFDATAGALSHQSEIIRLANRASALEQPQFAAERWHAMLADQGIVA